MSDVVRCFNEAGLVEFARWLRSGAKGAISTDLLTDPAYSVPLEDYRFPPSRNSPTDTSSVCSWSNY